MFKPYRTGFSKYYLQNFTKEEFVKKKRILSKKSNNIKVLNDNKKSTRFHTALNNEKDFINRYIKDDQQCNNLKKDLLNNKTNEKIKFIRQSKDKDTNLKYIFFSFFQIFQILNQVIKRRIYCINLIKF